jgi:beta-lactamase class A
MSIQQKIEALAAEFNGRIGISALNLQTNETYEYHADELFPTASVIKLGVLAALMAQCEAGQSSLDEPIMLRRADLTTGSGVLQYLTPGLTMRVRDYAFLMMNISDNLATNILIDYVGLKNIQTFLTESGFPDVNLHRKLVSGTPPQGAPQFGTATPQGFTRLITAVFRRQIVSPAACDVMMRLMDGVGSDRVGRYLPFSLYGNDGSDEQETEKLHLAGKTGSISGVRAQTAVVWQGDWQEARGFAITVMTADDPAPEMWSADAAGTLVIGRIARAVYDGIFS